MKTRYKCLSSILLPALTLGCFAYVPAELETVPLGTGVRAHLTNAGMQAVRNRMGIGSEMVKGTLVERRGSSVVFMVRSVSTSHSGVSLDNLYQQVDVPRRDIELVEQKKLNTTKTAVMIAGGVAVAGAFIYTAMQGEPGTYTPGPVVGPVDNIRVPFLLFRLVLPN